MDAGFAKFAKLSRYTVSLPLSAHICLALQWNIGPLWVHVDVNVIATLNSTIVSSCLAFATTLPTSAPLPPNPLYTLAQHYDKNRQKLVKTSHYLLARLVV